MFLQTNQVHTNQFHSFRKIDHVISGDDALVLPEIFNPGTNLAVWQRSLPATAQEYAAFLQTTTWQQQRVMINTSEVAEYLTSKLPEAPGRGAFIADIALLAEMYGCLFNLTEVGIRFARLNTAMCPKFHTDKLGCRLITTYAGVGTEWLKNEHVRRSDNGKVMYQTNAPVQQVATHDVAILKGDGWENNEHGGIVHRSPQLAENEARVVLTIDGF